MLDGMTTLLHHLGSPSTPSPRRLAAGLLALGLLLGTAACGSSGSDGASSSGDGSAADGGASDDGGGSGGGGDAGASSACGGEIYVATVCAEVAISGARTVDDTAASPVGGAVSSDGVATCATWAEGDDGDLELPLFLDGLSDGTRFGLESLVTDYGGPGTYDLDQLSGSGSNFTIALGEERFTASPDGGASASITVAADGSGSFSASGFQIDDGAGTFSDPIDAEVTWTCADA
jgi:hypothetical protein